MGYIYSHGIFPKTGNYGPFQNWDLSMPSERAPSNLSEKQRNCWIWPIRTLVTEPTLNEGDLEWVMLVAVFECNCLTMCGRSYCGLAYSWLYTSYMSYSPGLSRMICPHYMSYWSYQCMTWRYYLPLLCMCIQSCIDGVCVAASRALP